MPRSRCLPALLLCKVLCCCARASRARRRHPLRVQQACSGLRDVELEGRTAHAAGHTAF
jgi:hypothetical protein